MKVLFRTVAILLVLSALHEHSLRADAISPAIPLEGDEFLERFRIGLRHVHERRVNIVFYGASHIASDQYTSVVRARLRQRFGDGGLGLFLPARPFSLYDHRDVQQLVNAEGLSTRALHQNPQTTSDRRFGRAGMAVQLRPDAPIAFSIAEGVVSERLEIWYEADADTQASLECVCDDGTVVRAQRSSGFSRLEVPLSPSPTAASHRLTLHARAGPIRIFGVVALRSHGVVVEAFGVPGARARDMLSWDESVWSQQLQRMPPDPVVLGFGTNESGESRVSVEEDALALRALIGRVQQSAPQASCLVVGPSDRPRQRRGVWQTRPRNVAIARAYRTVATEAHCAFVDMMAFTGGPGTLDTWVQRGLALPDHVHFTDRGYRLFGEALARSLATGTR